MDPTNWDNGAPSQTKASVLAGSLEGVQKAVWET